MSDVSLNDFLECWSARLTQYIGGGKKWLNNKQMFWMEFVSESEKSWLFFDFPVCQNVFSFFLWMVWVGSYCGSKHLRLHNRLVKMSGTKFVFVSVLCSLKTVPATLTQILQQWWMAWWNVQMHNRSKTSNIHVSPGQKCFFWGSSHEGLLARAWNMPCEYLSS